MIRLVCWISIVFWSILTIEICYIFAGHWLPMPSRDSVGHVCGSRRSYTRRQLLLCTPVYKFVAPASPLQAVVDRVRELGISRRHRGCRSGKSVQSRRASLQLRGNGAYVITGNRNADRTPHRRRAVEPDRQPSLISVPLLRYADHASRVLTFRCLNIRSLSPLKLDDLLTEFRDRALDVLLMCETWHDSDSVTIRRLRSDSFTVVERARPRRVYLTHLAPTTVASPSSPPLASVCQLSMSVYNRRRLSSSLHMFPVARRPVSSWIFTAPARLRQPPTSLPSSSIYWTVCRRTLYR